MSLFAGPASLLRSEVPKELFTDLDRANDKSGPTAGTAEFLYERWVHPRYTDAERYEAEVAAMAEVTRKEYEERGEKELQSRLAAVPVDLAYNLMNDRYESWSVKYYFSGENSRSDRTLIKTESRLDIPSYAESNQYVTSNKRNSEQSTAWNGAVGLRQSRLGSSGWVATFETGSPPQMIKPPLDIHNAPKMTALDDRIRFVGSEQLKDEQGVDRLRVELANGKIRLLVWYTQSTYKFFKSESEEVGPEGELGKYRVVYSDEKDGESGLPRTVEFVSAFQKPGGNERIVDRQVWTLKSFDSSIPEKTLFNPPLHDEVVEVGAFNEGKEIIRALDPHKTPVFRKLLAAIESTGPLSQDTMQAYRLWVDSKSVEPDLSTSTRETTRKNTSVFLIINGAVILLLLVAVIARRYRGRGSD